MMECLQVLIPGSPWREPLLVRVLGERYCSWLPLLVRSKRDWRDDFEMVKMKFLASRFVANVVKYVHWHQRYEILTDTACHTGEVPR